MDAHPLFRAVLHYCLILHSTVYGDVEGFVQPNGFPNISKAIAMETHKLYLKRISGDPDSCVE